MTDLTESAPSTTPMNDYPTSLLLTSLASCIALCVVTLLLLVQAAIAQEWLRASLAGFAYVVFHIAATISLAKLAGWHE